jgi:hypothetical protein
MSLSAFTTSLKIIIKSTFRFALALNKILKSPLHVRYVRLEKALSRSTIAIGLTVFELALFISRIFLKLDVKFEGESVSFVNDNKTTVNFDSLLTFAKPGTLAKVQLSEQKSIPGKLKDLVNF